ncbi:DinB family protein [Paenibacillus montanisoli]|uniref:DinB family protein n=1 Tax=Paenibacillus montanisoli TaxID=2081970 RepID=A0A328U590_9BACL|nr:DinB family protein [Paenibacillus montanisoli]RAP77242.1 DinB family protein [Paenibacillus montanisoli]
MNYKSILIDQLNACYNDKSWFIPLQEVLIDLNAEQAAREYASKQSIWAIVNHLIFWNEKWLERFEIEQFELPGTTNNEDTFYVDPNTINDAEWNRTLQRLDLVFRSWNTALEKSEEFKLSSEISSYFNAPWWGVVSNLCLHNAYHIGQIMLLKKLMQLQKID